MMETLIGTTLLLLAFAMLVLRYGVDSRVGLRTKEQRLAAYGFVWAARAGEQKLVRSPPIVPQDRRLNGPVRVR
jgi:hypothetical protein